MSLFPKNHPISIKNNNSLLNDLFFNNWEKEWYNHPLISFPSINPHYYSHNSMNTLEKQISEALKSDVFKSVDFCPNINLIEDEKKYYIHVDLPGMTKDQIKIELSDENRTLIISGERESVINDEKNKMKKEMDKEIINENNETKQKKDNNHIKKYSKIECNYGKFERSFNIPENANIDSIQAKMENGVLEVIINKIETPKRLLKKSIQIQ